MGSSVSREPEWASNNFEGFEIRFQPMGRIVSVTPEDCPELTFKHPLAEGKHGKAAAGETQEFIRHNKKKINKYRELRNDAMECGFTITEQKKSFLLTANGKTAQLPVTYDALSKNLQEAVRIFLETPGEHCTPVAIVPKRQRKRTAEEIPPEDLEIRKHLFEAGKIIIPGRSLQNAILRYFGRTGDTERDEFLQALAHNASNFDPEKPQHPASTEEEYLNFNRAVFSGVGKIPSIKADSTQRILEAMAKYLGDIQEAKLEEPNKGASSFLREDFKKDMGSLLEIMRNPASARDR